MKEKQRSGIPLPVFNQRQRKAVTTEGGSINGKTETTTVLPPITTPSGSSYVGQNMRSSTNNTSKRVTMREEPTHRAEGESAKNIVRSGEVKNGRTSVDATSRHQSKGSKHLADSPEMLGVQSHNRSNVVRKMDQEGKLPTKLIAPPQEVGGGIEHQKAAIRRKTEIKLENLSDLVQYQEPSKALSFAPRHPGSGGQLCGSAKRKLIRKTSMGDLQQERVELVMKREELAKEWLDSDRERQRFQVKVLHANLNMRTIETQLEQMTRREIELRTEVQRRTIPGDQNKNSKKSRTRARNIQSKQEQQPQPQPQLQQQPQLQEQQPQQHNLPKIYNNRQKPSLITTDTTADQQLNPQPPRYQQPTYSRRLRQAVESTTHNTTSVTLPPIVEKKRPPNKETPTSTIEGRPSAPHNSRRRSTDGSEN